jgi:hypothetical protein
MQKAVDAGEDLVKRASLVIEVAQQKTIKELHVQPRPPGDAAAPHESDDSSDDDDDDDKDKGRSSSSGSSKTTVDHGKQVRDELNAQSKDSLPSLAHEHVLTGRRRPRDGPGKVWDWKRKES